MLKARNECSRFGTIEFSRKGAKFAALAVLLSLVAGCGPNHRLSSFEDEDLRSLHPVRIKPAERSLVVFGSGRGGDLDAAESDKVVQFAREYTREARGVLNISIPTAPASKSRALPPNLRRAVDKGGAGGARIVVTPYPAAGSLVSPIKLSYVTVEAVVDRGCPDAANRAVGNKADPGSGALGCAYTAAIAGQVKEVSDLVESRAVSATDQTKRFPVRTGKGPNI